MSSKIQIENFTSLNIKERTSLTTGLDPAATIMPLANTNNLLADDFILVGTPGAETGEIRKVVTVDSDVQVTADPTTLPHAAGESVLALFGDQISIYRAPNSNGIQPADSDFTLLITVDIDSDQLQTEYTDPDGSDIYWYKFAYHNSVSNTTTSLSQWAARGGSTYVYASNDSIRDLAGFKNNRNIPEALVDQFRVSAQAKIDGMLSGRYPVPFKAPINPFIAQIARTMAAGYLQLDQFGSYTTTDTSNGQLKVDWAEAQLKDIISGEVKLTDPIDSGDGGSSTPSNDLGMSGWPNGRTVDQYGNNDFMFKRSSIDGYEGRRY